MARIENLRLADRGRRRRAVFTLRGTVAWEEGDANRNGGEILVTFRGQDAGADDLIWNYVQWAAKELDDRTVAEGIEWTITADGPDQSMFVLEVENTNAVFPRRRFNEDIPGRDEVYAEVVIRDSSGSNISERVRSNTVTGRY